MNGFTPSYKSSEDIVMPKKNDTKIKPLEIFDMPKVSSAMPKVSSSTSSNQKTKKSKPKKNEKKITKKKNKYKK